MPARKSNLWPFSSRKTAPKTKPVRSSMTVGQAMQRAFKAGQETGDTGLFGQWLESSGLSGRGNVLRARLKREYERGFETKFNEPPAPVSHARRLEQHKGRKIEAHEDGTFSVPSLEKETRFDSIADAKRFIDSWKRNPKRLQNPTREEILTIHRKRIPDCTCTDEEVLTGKMCKACLADWNRLRQSIKPWQQERHQKNANAFETWLKNQNIDYEREGGLGSQYFHFDFGTIRFSDHKQPQYGGYSEEKGYRHGAAEISVAPGDKTPADARHWLKQQIKQELRENPTDRALRYRANQTPPAGPKQCAFCGSKDTIEIGHIDGHEEHGEPENLIWTCRSCNVIAANTMRQAGIGRLTRQFNPTKSGGAANVGEWMNAVGAIVPHKGAKYSGQNYGLASTMSTADAVAMIRATPAHKRSEFAGKIRTSKKSRRNPQSEADALSESFHGRPASETILVEETVHEHEHLAALGTLTELVIETVTGLLATISFDETDSPYLASSEDGRQLYIEGGDQELDLESLQMDGDEWIKDRMVIGIFASPEPREKGRNRRKHNLTYRTKKDFDHFEEIDYQHDLGEETGVRPILVYAPRDKHLYIEGGQYRIEQPLIGTSPGIEN